MAQARVSKQWLQRQFQSSGIQIEPTALVQLISVVEEIDDPERFLHALLDEIERNAEERKLTVGVLNDVLRVFEGHGRNGNPIEVIDAFDVPYIQYDPIRKLFHHTSQPRSVLADIPSKIQLYIDRFLIIQQRLRRHRLFRPVQWGNLGGGRAARDIAELTELKALLGRVGERRYVMGFLSRHDEGRYFIEDLSARLPLDVSGAETADGLFTENCIIVAEGELTPGGSFRALALGLPPAEPREESLLALQGLDFFGGQHGSSSKCSELDQAQWAARHDEDRVILLSDVALDRPEILERLRTIFGAFEAVDPPPSAFVLIGNFQSYDANVADTSFARLRDNFATLAGIIGHYPSLRTHSRFLLVPGPRDVGPAEALPRPSLPRSIVAPLLDSLPNIQLCSNPCRIRHGHMELVIFRSDLHKTMRGLCILPSKTTPDGHSSTVFEHLCATVLQESHMCPVPLEYQPVVWEWDHSLWLYPVPHGLVLADAEPAARFTFDTCSCLNPGSLLEGTFGAWRPTTNEMELCDVAAAADDEEEGEDDVSEIEEIEEENEEGGDVVVD